MDIATTFWNLLVNPNVVYLLFVIGLWALVTAIATPGTGFPEAAAVICLALAVLGLARLPVNLAGAALIVVSVILLALDLTLRSHGALTLGGVVIMALGSLFLFRPIEGQPGVSLWVVGITVVLSAFFVGVVLAAVVRTQHSPPAMPPKPVIGQVGEVRTAIDPVGAVQLHSELWSAKAEAPGEVIESGSHVVVVGIEGLTLRVKQVSDTPPEGARKETAHG
jgi:membrane-bound serine protease (ClpP class)